jgi:hypothetical protein
MSASDILLSHARAEIERLQLRIDLIDAALQELVATVRGGCLSAYELSDATQKITTLNATIHSLSVALQARLICADSGHFLLPASSPFPVAGNAKPEDSHEEKRRRFRSSDD